MLSGLIKNCLHHKELRILTRNPFGSISTDRLWCLVRRVTQNKLEKWLCLMLDADGENRGGGLSLDWRPVCFVVLDEIIATKVSSLVITL